MKKFYTPKNYILNCYSKEEFIKIFEKYLNDEDVLTKFKKKVRRIIKGIENKDFGYVFEIRQLTGSINGNPFLSTKGLSNYYIFHYISILFQVFSHYLVPKGVIKNVL